MTPMKALLSVSDKSGLVEFAQGLHAHAVKLIASGGTARALATAGLPVMTVEDFTNSPEILGGRVKTLHPRIHGGILARATAEDQADLSRIGSDYIDIVVANLYPFQKTVANPSVTLAEAIEDIDIGGVTLIRAAAKNHARTTIVCDPADYATVLADLDHAKRVSDKTRTLFALKAFAHTAEYDAAIRDYLAHAQPDSGDDVTLKLHKVQGLRYGENPHQTATLYRVGDAPAYGPLGGRILQGKELSYNNLLDLDAAWRAAQQFTDQAIVIVKHLSPCGIASGANQPDVFAAALACDPISAFGGVIALNRELTAETVRAFGDLFIECIAAPSYSAEAISLLAKRKNCRVVQISSSPAGEPVEYRSITGGILAQSADHGDPDGTHYKTVSAAQPDAAQLRTLHFAMMCAQHVKSNAIVFARQHSDGVLATVGIGGGQPNRVDCVRIARQRAGDAARGAVMASDAFFPFPDGVQEAIAGGIVAIVQPGGSVRDAESIAAADAQGVVMVTTGVRHFRH